MMGDAHLGVEAPRKRYEFRRSARMLLLSVQN